MSDHSTTDAADRPTSASGPPGFKPTIVGAASASTPTGLHGAGASAPDVAPGMRGPGAGELGELELNALLGRTNLGVAACNASGALTYLSPALQEWTGQPFEPHAEVERVARFRLYESDASTILQPEAVPLARARRGELVSDELICARSAAGRLLYLLCNALPVTSPDGSLVGAVALVQDVTAEHAVRQEQEQVHDRLVVTLKHEFRPPLTKLIGYAEILADLSDEFPPEAARFLSKIRLAVEELTWLVDSVTSLVDLQESTPHSGTMRETAAPTRKQVEVRESEFEEFKARMRAEGHRIVSSAPHPTGYTVTVEW